MAKQTLPTNFKDDVLAASMGGKRRYVLTDNGDGTFSLEDATTYTQVGDVFGQARLNAICKAINESVDQARVIESVDDLKALTEAGFVVGGKAGAQIISNLNNGNLTMDYTDGALWYNVKVGADTVRKKLGELSVIAYLYAPQNTTKSFVADTNYQNMIVCTLDTRKGYAQIKINGVLANVTETALSGDAGYITINTKIQAGDTVSITPKGGSSDNKFWFLGV